MSELRTRNLRAGYGDGPDILQDISIDAGRPEIVAILGPNGCGKSTLLKSIAGFVRPRAGEVLIGDAPSSHIPMNRKMRERGVGYVPQSANVFGTLTVAENILLAVQHLGRSEASRRLDEILDLYPGLADKTRRKASALSGGERQILSLGRALAAHPRVLLLDEPSAGLSPSMMSDVFSVVARIRDDREMCILMVEQNAREALSIADRAYVLVLGEIAMEGRAEDLIRDPAMNALYLGGNPDGP